MFEFNESLKQALTRNVQDALREDIGIADWTAQLVPPNERVRAHVVVKQAGAILCGQAWFELCIKSLDQNAQVQWLYEEGQPMQTMTPVCEIVCNARALLSAERSALNFLQTLSWTASSTKVYVDAIADIQVNQKTCKILETRKTIPGLRQAQKYAVRVGGGKNHRLALWDGILIKENHIIAAGSIQAALTNAKALNSGVMIQIEVESIAELEEALAGGAEHILIDDFSIEDMRRAVEITKNRAELEVSGGVDMSKLRDIALTGVDRISIGGITKNVIAVDYSMRVLERISS
jgi:nicotinate-nucleotide pyrophosphorylase (carboxylating)